MQVLSYKTRIPIGDYIITAEYADGVFNAEAEYVPTEQFSDINTMDCFNSDYICTAMQWDPNDVFPYEEIESYMEMDRASALRMFYILHDINEDPEYPGTAHLIKVLDADREEGWLFASER